MINKTSGMNKNIYTLYLFLFWSSILYACSRELPFSSQSSTNKSIETMEYYLPLIPLISIQPVGDGNIYYVSPDGDDNNPGTKNSPWHSPGYASRQLKPGDTFIIMDRQYLLSQFYADILKPTSGEPDAWITIRGETGKRPILAGQDNLTMTIDLSGANYIWLENLEITHNDNMHGKAKYFRDAILIANTPVSDIIIKKLYIHHIDEFGIDFQDV